MTAFTFQSFVLPVHLSPYLFLMDGTGLNPIDCWAIDDWMFQHNLKCCLGSIGGEFGALSTDHPNYPNGHPVCKIFIFEGYSD